jgi:hypothetical protein
MEKIAVGLLVAGQEFSTCLTHKRGKVLDGPRFDGVPVVLARPNAVQFEGDDVKHLHPDVLVLRETLE